MSTDRARIRQRTAPVASDGPVARGPGCPLRPRSYIPVTSDLARQARGPGRTLPAHRGRREPSLDVGGPRIGGPPPFGRLPGGPNETLITSTQPPPGEHLADNATDVWPARRLEPETARTRGLDFMCVAACTRRPSRLGGGPRSLCRWVLGSVLPVPRRPPCSEPRAQGPRSRR